MGKNKDRIYETAGERRDQGTGHSGRIAQNSSRAKFSRLPFYCCAITFQPFEDPVCAPDGTVFDIVNAVPYIRKHGRHPVTGEPLELKHLTRLHFHRNTDGEYDCPVLGKVFNQNTHIVAIGTTGNVYCWDAIKELCLKPKNLHDLITDEPFTKKDIIHLQDPNNISGKNIAEFDHVKHGRHIEDESEIEKREADPMFGIRNIDEGTRRALAALGTSEASAAAMSGGGGKKAEAERLLLLAKSTASTETRYHDDSTAPRTSTSGSDPRLKSAPRVDVMKNVKFKPGTSTWNTDVSEKDVNADKDFDPNGGRTVPEPYSNTWVESFSTTGQSAVSLTSTSMSVSTKQERKREREYLHPNKKGYARIHTELGSLNLELHCDLVPKTCENWLALAESGYYNGTVFHRVIKNFMAQGGDPTGTGKGGSSIWGATFEDEFHHSLSHNTRGVLSMCNAGPNTNGSQFFITFKSAHHLDRKHTVFGKVVGGFETLTSLERLPTDDEDRPIQKVAIESVEIFVNPFKELLAEKVANTEAKDMKKEKPGAKSDHQTKKRKIGFEKDNSYLNDHESTWLGGPGKKPALMQNTYDTMNDKSASQSVGRYLKIPTTISSTSQAKPKQDTRASKPPKPMANFDAW